MCIYILVHVCICVCLCFSNIANLSNCFAINLSGVSLPRFVLTHFNWPLIQYGCFYYECFFFFYFLCLCINIIYNQHKLLFMLWIIAFTSILTVTVMRAYKSFGYVNVSWICCCQHESNWQIKSIAGEYEREKFKRVCVGRLAINGG